MKKTCPSHPDSTYPAVERIVAIGDIHGDKKLLLSNLKIASLIDDDNNWIGGNTYVVQVGDQIDRCRPFPGEKCSDAGVTVDDENSDLFILEFMNQLDEQAQKQGGHVLSLVGNHEIMNVQGNMDYVSKKGLEGFSQGRVKAFARGKAIATMLACTRNSAVIIGKNLFVHAGLMPDLYQKYGADLDKINDAVRGWLLGTDNTKAVEEILNSTSISPFWPREYGIINGNNPPECENLLDPVLRIYGVQNMIVGHSPQFFSNAGQGINAVCNNRLHRIDTGSSRAFARWDKQESKNRQVQVLEILNDRDYYIITKDDRYLASPKKHHIYSGGRKKYHLVKK